MIRFAALVTGLLFWAGLSAAQTVTSNVSLPVKAQALKVHVSGRVEPSVLSDGRTAYRHQWPGVYFETAFTGAKVYLSFNDPYNEYRLHIDDLKPISLDRPGEGTIEISGLTNKAHRLRLEKVTESILNSATFNGFYAPAGTRSVPEAHRARQIEFIGDSGMVGYGNRSTTTKCTSEEVRKLTDTQQAWPALAARHFNADYQINAISGRGVVRNYNGTTPDYTMSDVYPYTFFDKTVPYDSKDWQPQIILVALGGNDLTPLQPGEAYKSIDEVGDALVAGLGRFVGQLHRRYPNASVVVQWPGHGDNEVDNKAIDAGQDAIEKAAEAAGLKRLAFMIAPKGFSVDLSACDYHGSLAGHRAAADWTIGWLKEHAELWQGK